jgi:DNA-binding response OmpR family regulator
MLDFGIPTALAGNASATDSADVPFASRDEEQRRIVVVDENRESAAALGIHLQAAGHQVLVTHSGKEAWQVCKDFAPHAMIVNIGLPRLNGFQLARRVRRAAWGRHALLIAVTGGDKSGDTQLAKFVGFDHFCDQPTNFEEIERLLQ